MTIKIIGLNNDLVISSAALVVDGEVVAAAAEERFTRQKHTRDFPINAINFCLKEYGCYIDDIDAIVVHWNPGEYMQGFNSLLSGARRFKGEYLYSVPDYISTLIPNKKIEHIEQVINYQESELKIYYVTHHRAHAANGFYLSPYEEAAIFTADSQGELECTTYGYGNKTSIETFKTMDYPQSIGALYASVTEYLGFKPNSDEWQVMALASYSETDNYYYKIFRDMVSLRENGEYEIDLTYLSGYNWDQPKLFTPKMESVFGKTRHPREPLEQKHYEIAAGVQKITEDIVYHCLNWLSGEVTTKNIALSGGVFMNCVMNAKISSNTPFENVFVSSCPDDSGNAIGSALWGYHQIMSGTKRFEQTHNYYGPMFKKSEILESINKYKLSNFTHSDNVELDTAKLLANGNLIGWFQGRMEFGQRSLGNRSILADATSVETKDRINAAVKYRESFRPFAPSVLQEYVEDYFEVEHDTKVPFMEKVYPVKDAAKEKVPAIVHSDGSARIQTVDHLTNPRFHKLITEYMKITGIPLILNTSLNVSGDPIVNTPMDAIRTFFSSGLDVLVIGDYIVYKTSDQREQ